MASQFSEREVQLLAEYEAAGVRPISPVIAAQFYELFLENYPCSEIARLNKGFTEGDVLFLAKKFEWYRKRDEYAKNLQEQVGQKLAKQELESIEYLTNLLSVAHKQHKEQMVKYLQSGKKEDLPENSIGSMKAYKDAIELIQKVTGKDKLSKQEIKSETTTIFKIDDATKKLITPEVQANLLTQMMNEKEGKK